MFEQTFKNIDKTLRTEAGCQNELGYIEQTSWIIFLKYLDDLETDREAAAALSGKSYTPILGAEYRWKDWACPKTTSGQIDHNKALTGDDRTEFVSKAYASGERRQDGRLVYEAAWSCGKGRHRRRCRSIIQRRCESISGVFGYTDLARQNREVV